MQKRQQTKAIECFMRSMAEGLYSSVREIGPSRPREKTRSCLPCRLWLFTFIQFLLLLRGGFSEKLSRPGMKEGHENAGGTSEQRMLVRQLTHVDIGFQPVPEMLTIAAEPSET